MAALLGSGERVRRGYRMIVLHTGRSLTSGNSLLGPGELVNDLLDIIDALLQAPLLRQPVMFLLQCVHAGRRCMSCDSGGFVATIRVTGRRQRTREAEVQDSVSCKGLPSPCSVFAGVVAV